MENITTILAKSLFFIDYICPLRKLGALNKTWMRGSLMDARILLVDDDRLLREVIGEYLTLNGYVVDYAEDAEAALAKFRPGQYDLALIDLVMPGMNGLELMQRLLQLDAELFCLIMTGYPTIDSAYKSMVEGASDYIIKPFQLNELLSAIRQHID